MPNGARELEASWDAKYGDRKQELVFIGADFDADDLRRRLDLCLTESRPAHVHSELVDEEDCFPVGLRKPISMAAPWYRRDLIPKSRAYSRPAFEATEH
jgi:hypothetical protein